MFDLQATLPLAVGQRHSCAIDTMASSTAGETELMQRLAGGQQQRQQARQVSLYAQNQPGYDLGMLILRMSHVARSIAVL